MRGSKGPFLCFLLIPSHFGKMSHQGDCVTANFHSCAFCYSYHILGQSVNGRNVGNYVDVLGKLSSQLIITWLEKRWKQRHPYDDSGVFSQTTSKETKIRNISGVLATLAPAHHSYPMLLSDIKPLSGKLDE
ncbi:NADH-quinone oxidoreductase subunit [Trichinella pseudospiralis]